MYYVVNFQIDRSHLNCWVDSKTYLFDQKHLSRDYTSIISSRWMYRFCITPSDNLINIIRFSLFDIPAITDSHINHDVVDVTENSMKWGMHKRDRKN